MSDDDANRDQAEPKAHEKVDFVQLILDDIGGTFARYQILNYILFCIPFAISGTFGLSYVFTALNLEYRCNIAECESATYAPDWLPNAIPHNRGIPAKCLRYEYTPTANNSIVDIDDHGTCAEDQFDRTKIYQCDVDQLVYKTDEVSIVNEFHLNCDENNWKLAMVGTVNNIGRFIFTPVMGLLSDRFGRRTVLVIGVLGSSIFGMARSFSTTYIMFLVFEFLDAAIGTVTYSASFVLAMEWIGVKDRVLLGTIITATYPFGQVFLGLVARYTRNFRHLIRIVYAPGFLIVAYLWIAPESIRWLIVNGKRKQTLDTLKRAEKINKVEISSSTLSVLEEKFNQRNKSADSTKDERTDGTGYLIRKIFTQRIFLTRFLVCLFAWIANAFISYGISLTSVSLGGDKYVNFIVIALAGIPAMFICYAMLEKCGRRWTLCSALIIGGSSIVASKLLPADLRAVSICLFFIGKLFITVSFTGLYVYTSELWPTNLRHSIMGLCSTAGRLGAMFAPLAPLLSQYLDILPYLTFGGMALIAGILILLLPETLNRKLPDTLQEAGDIEPDYTK